MSGDPGPVARFEEMAANPSSGEVIVQRLMGGESLSQIAKSWGLPRTRFLAWIAANGELTEQCKRARELAGIELRMEGLDLLDAADAESISVVKEQAAYRERLSRDLNRPLFGKYTKHEHAVTVDLGERLRRARERVIDAVAEDVAKVSLPDQVPATAHELI